LPTRRAERQGKFGTELSADACFIFAGKDRIIFSSEQDGRNHLYSIPSGGGFPTILTPGQFDIEDVALSADRLSVIYTSNQEDIDRRHVWRVGVDGNKPQAVTKGDTIEWAPVETGQGNYLLCLGSSATAPAMPYRIVPQGRTMIASAALPSDFPSNQLIIPKQVVFKSDDGFEIHGQLFVPVSRSGPGPALIFMHGGPIRQMLLGFHYMYYYHNGYAMNQYLASQGYVVLSVNYRLGIMYGRAFREPANAGWRGASEYKDILAGAKFLQTLPVVDTKKIGLWGGSYGGYLTALGLARNSDIFAGGMIGRSSCPIGRIGLERQMQPKRRSWRSTLLPTPRSRTGSHPCCSFTEMTIAMCRSVRQWTWYSVCVKTTWRSRSSYFRMTSMISFCGETGLKPTRRQQISSTGSSRGEKRQERYSGEESNYGVGGSGRLAQA